MIRTLIVVTVLVTALVGVAHAYPQFQLVKDQNCSSCHLSPAGGGLLSENGLATAEGSSQWGQAPEFFYNKLPLPNWLELGGDVRAATGYDVAGDNRGAVLFPMQAELTAAATYKNLSLHVTAGLRDPQYANDATGYDPATLVGSREHWLQWQQNPGESDGLFVRVGRFMPVFGLRFAEHPEYVRRYGGTPLYGETYAAAIEYIAPSWEIHATGFVEDPLFDSTELGNGGAVYAEARVSPSTALGLEAKVDDTHDDRHTYVGVTAKQRLRADLVVAGEVEFVHEKVKLGGIENQLVATAVASYFVGPLMVDLGLNVYHEDLDFRLLEQQALDLNIHWFMTSHVELLLTNRFQTLNFTADGQSSGYSLLQVHYRL
jgi:hypothetical protein